MPTIIGNGSNATFINPSGIIYYYIFTTGTNSITFQGGLNCEILIVGGGGGGSSGFLGAGGAGGAVYYNNLYLQPIHLYGHEIKEMQLIYLDDYILCIYTIMIRVTLFL